MSRRQVIPAYVHENFQILEEVAKGKFGVVYKCEEKKTNQVYAVKVMKKRNNKLEDVQREVEVLKQLDHPNLLLFKNFTAADSCFVLVTEFLSGGELFDYVTTKEYLVESEAVMFLKQIVVALEYLHSKSICHLDMKPENIVLKAPGRKELTIIDFGAAHVVTKGKMVQALAGTPEFVAPEVLNYDPISSAADMWAVGVITFCLLTGCSPFLGETDAETLQSVQVGEFEFPEEDPAEGYTDISDHAKQFISSLLILNPRERASANQARQHNWIEKSDELGSSRINTERLKRLRRRRKLQAAFHAVRITVGLSRLTGLGSTSSSSRSDSDHRGSVSSATSNGSVTDSPPMSPLSSSTNASD